MSEWFVHYKIGGIWMVDGPYLAESVTNKFQDHKRDSEYEDGYVHDSRTPTVMNGLTDAQ